ncbi:hypothetical protein ABE65_018595 [Fictibacillus phosphorivorans]|uniref:Uncharacterized protein n=1 Tax=Fictibacillus phosphorivorans TaxID=1221500 RepID=A0A160IR24_9BACL|nr:hypothetical protein ABE65_018595 [Fictibacillus phosphorivorans]
MEADGSERLCRWSENSVRVSEKDRVGGENQQSLSERVTNKITRTVMIYFMSKIACTIKIPLFSTHDI